MTIRRLQPSAARRVGRSTFAASAAVALYTSAGFGALLYTGWFDPALACLIAAAGGLLVAAVAGRIVYRSERRERHRRVAQAQLETARDRAETAAAAPEKERGFAVAERREMRESREVQASLLPRTIPAVDHYHIEVDYRPCGVLGGDFYDFRRCADGSILMTVGDVSGKGPAGAIVMAMVQTLFRDHADRAAGPADLLYRVNTGFAGALGKGIFVTALAGWLDPVGHRFTLAGAGHHPVLLLNPSERRSTHIRARGLALGLVGGEEFANALVETTIDLAAGDSLLLYTDGATESAEDVAKGGGENRFRAAAAAAVLPGPQGALQRLVGEIGQSGAFRDDTTMVLLSRLGDTAAGPLESDRSTGKSVFK